MEGLARQRIRLFLSATPSRLLIQEASVRKMDDFLSDVRTIVSASLESSDPLAI